MRCKKSERWISDRLGGALPEAKARRLDAHLAGCSSCRSALRGQERLQARGPGLLRGRSGPGILGELDRPAPGEARSGSGPLGSSRRAGPGFRSRPALGLGGRSHHSGRGRRAVSLGPPRGRCPANSRRWLSKTPTAAWPSRSGPAPISNRTSTASLQTTIGEHAAGVDGEAHHLLYGDSEFLDSLSDEEVQVLDAELGRVLKI